MYVGTGVFLGAACAAKKMVELKKGGSIIATASYLGLRYDKSTTLRTETKIT